jgi:ElaA protein
VLHVAAFTELDPGTLYALLQLRAQVFVVEQSCPYVDLDGRDLEPPTRHVWLTHGGRPVAYLRLLLDPDGSGWIGRVCVAADARGRGHAGQLMARALVEAGDRPVYLFAQAHLTGFYAGFGFTVSGAQFDEDGIAHVPMHRPAGVSADTWQIDHRRTE